MGSFEPDLNVGHARAASSHEVLLVPVISITPLNAHGVSVPGLPGRTMAGMAAGAVFRIVVVIVRGLPWSRF